MGSPRPTTRVAPYVQNPVTFGRLGECTVQVTNPLVSKRHCEVFFRGSRPFLRDTSSNGTAVGANTVKGGEVELSNGARVALVMPRNRRALFSRDGVAFIYQDVSDELRRACPRPRLAPGPPQGTRARPDPSPPSQPCLSRPRTRTWS